MAVPHASLVALIWTSFGVASLFFALRTAIRCKIARRPAADDYWVTTALLALLALCVLETIQLPSLYHMTGTLQGTISISLDLIGYTEDYVRWQFAIIILYWTVLWSVKAGFLSLYFKFFKELKHYRRVWYVLVVFTLLAYGGCVITLCLSCGTIDKFFKFAQCGRPEQIWASNLSVYYSTSVDVFTDLCIMAMPLQLIYNVKKITIRQKLGLTAVFCLCFIMIAFSIVRAKQVLVPSHFVDLTLLMIWSTLAASISVIVGSLPALKIFLTSRATAKRSRDDSFGSRRAQGGQQTGNAAAAHTRSVPMRSLSTEKNSPRYNSEPSESQEEILRSDDGARFVMVKTEPGPNMI